MSDPVMAQPGLPAPVGNASESPPRKRLTRPRDNRWIAGVCSGLARRYGLRPGLVRFLFVASCLLPGPQTLIYIMAWVIIPSE
jgi:phage shock protein PspC (stress-responsive transcriptional regulator)